MSILERALRELESATAMVAEGELAAAKDAMDRRQRAISEISRLAMAVDKLSSAERDDILGRLERAKDAGVQVEQWLLTVKSEAMAEWNQWSHIYRALGAAYESKPSMVDCSG